MRTLFLTCSFLIFSLGTIRAEKVTAQFLNGQWSLESISHYFHRAPSNETSEIPLPAYDGPWAEEELPYLPGDNIWIFSNDGELTRYYYPFSFIDVLYFELDSGRLYYYQSDYWLAEVREDSGKLVAYFDDAKLVFHRDTLKPDVMSCLSVLRTDTINPGLMIADYHMVTHFVPDDEAAYDFKPPLKMPMKISIADSTQARNIYHSGVIYLNAGGRKRPYTVVSVEWDQSYYAHRSEFYSVDVPIITLVPGDWWKGEPFEVIYRGNEKELAKKQKK